MEIEVHLHTTLQKQILDKVVDKLTVEIPAGSTLKDLLSHLDIQMNPESLLLVVNGRAADIDHVLAAKDVVNLIPAISGG